MKDIELWEGDCLELMDDIPDNYIDFIFADLPYEKTRNKWDSLIPLDLLWKQYKRIIKSSGSIVLFGQDKFTAKVMLSNASWHRYNWIWEKTQPTGYLNANRMPLRVHEDLMVFYENLPTYNPQKTYGHSRKVSTAVHKRNSKKTSNYGEHGLTSYDSTERYPRSVLKFKKDQQKSALHPTQKPLALCEYIVSTYTNIGDLVLDNVMGSGTTGEACVNLGRRFIGIEKDPVYYDVARSRLTHKPCL